MEISLIFLECVSVEGAKDQLMVGGKKAGIKDSIAPNNLSIQAEKIVWSRLNYFPLALLVFVKMFESLDLSKGST